ncbi:unnamed protein product, partial [Cyprideis torosa]
MPNLGIPAEGEDLDPSPREDMVQHLLQTPRHHIDYVKYLEDEVDTVPIISDSEKVMVVGAERWSGILRRSKPEPWDILSKECICGMIVEKYQNHACILIQRSTSDVYEVQCKACLKKIKCPSSAKDHVMGGCPNLKPRFKCHICDKDLKSLWRLKKHLGPDGHGLADFIVEAELRQRKQKPSEISNSAKNVSQLEAKLAEAQGKVTQLNLQLTERDQALDKEKARSEKIETEKATAERKAKEMDTKILSLHQKLKDALARNDKLENLERQARATGILKNKNN